MLAAISSSMSDYPHSSYFISSFKILAHRDYLIYTTFSRTGHPLYLIIYRPQLPLILFIHLRLPISCPPHFLRPCLIFSSASPSSSPLHQHVLLPVGPPPRRSARPSSLPTLEHPSSLHTSPALRWWASVSARRWLEVGLGAAKGAESHEHVLPAMAAEEASSAEEHVFPTAGRGVEEEEHVEEHIIWRAPLSACLRENLGEAAAGACGGRHDEGWRCSWQALVAASLATTDVVLEDLGGGAWPPPSRKGESPHPPLPLQQPVQ